MDTGMAYELAKLHIDDLLRDADRERLAKLATESRRPGPVDASPFRERLSRLIASVPLTPKRTRLAGA